MKQGYKQVKRMTPAMRIIHWVNAICMIGAIATGLYIGHPYYQTFIADPAVDKYVMAWNRYGHFIIAIIFDVTSVIIAYLYFFSRFEKPYKKLIPNSKNVSEFGAVLVNLITLNRKKEFDSSHADSFNTVYFTIFHILLIWMLFTGLQLYVHGLGSGISSIGAWWPWMLHLVTDWTIPVTGGTLMDVRISHHTTMWWIICWVVFHIYYQIWRTIFWKEADIAIVIGGSKFVKE
ncbi:cytochrome b/b6 domain-containing protein [Sulfuricurvum sp.]|uniref:cytochrome b/b6 domain-containing protein n=1 Tax=Sulfuricurvum sp. TaxID=2025608 RepID=UPI00260F2325|nr:cytochrome b/b6 domain-containing protein [Sulfuricurvum sp.]MDD2782281.1 cytochrome b/b6 domain-containing protein [Sulfuricurvum sp.]